MNEIRYFRAGPGDAEAVTKQRLEVLVIFQGNRPPEEVEALRPQLLRTIRDGLADETYVCWLASLSDEIVGSGGMSIRQRPGGFRNPSGRTGYIMSMYTRPDQRGQGICSELVRRLLATGAKLGIEHFELHATPAGEPVYQKLGFELHPGPTYLLYRKIGDEPLF